MNISNEVAFKATCCGRHQNGIASLNEADMGKKHMSGDASQRDAGHSIVVYRIRDIGMVMLAGRFRAVLYQRSGQNEVQPERTIPSLWVSIRQGFVASRGRHEDMNLPEDGMGKALVIMVVLDESQPLAQAGFIPF